MAYPNLPGVQVNTVDGGLVTRRVPRAKSTLVVGTAAKGPAENPVQVIDRAAAALTFGFSGNLIRAMEEVATYSDNVILVRTGTKPMALANVGKEFAVATNITNVARTSNVVTVTSAAHGLSVGDTVKVAAVTNTAINGEFVVETVPLSSTFTYTLVGTNIVSGADTGTVAKRIATGFSIAFGERTSDAQTRYTIWYKDAILAVWLDGNLVFSNDSGLGSVDTGDLVITGLITGSLGLQLGTGASALLSAAITVQAASALSGTAIEPTPAITQPVTGVGLTDRQTYVALAKSLELLEIFQVDQIYCPDAFVDQPNVSKYVPSDVLTATNNPATNPDALDWIKVTTNSVGNKTYQWASDTVDSEGATVAAMGGGVTTPAQRLAAGFYEASFPYLVANFCEKQGATLRGCIGFIPTLGPKTFRLTDTRDWVGFLPTYGNVGNPVPTVPGKGLLGIAELVGTTAGKLHTLASDKATGRAPGFFRNAAQQYDGGADLDINQNPVDIGAFLHIVADNAVVTNGYAANYQANLAGVVAGVTSILDEKSNLTNKQLNVVQLWKPAQSQLDALAFAKINMLRFKGLLQIPVLLHGITAASAFSDYTNLLRVRIKFLIVGIIFDEADKFIGESTIDGLQLTAMKTSLESRAIQLQKRGYTSFADFNISTTDADRRIGHARIDVKFGPADELVQLQAFVGVARR
jgi:hypothetical protein